MFLYMLDVVAFPHIIGDFSSHYVARDDYRHNLCVKGCNTVSRIVDIILTFSFFTFLFISSSISLTVSVDGGGGGNCE